LLDDILLGERAFEFFEDSRAVEDDRGIEIGHGAEEPDIEEVEFEDRWVFGGAVLAWGLSKDAERSDLAAHGVAVTYHLTTCDAGLKDGLTCRGSFTFNGVIYRESLSGVLDSPPDGSMVAALVDPTHPGTSVWTVAAVRGPDASVSSETVGGVAALVVGLCIVVFGLRRKRSSQQPSA
jgi:hypothetical protein